MTPQVGDNLPPIECVFNFPCPFFVPVSQDRLVCVKATIDVHIALDCTISGLGSFPQLVTVEPRQVEIFVQCLVTGLVF